MCHVLNLPHPVTVTHEGFFGGLPTKNVIIHNNPGGDCYCVGGVDPRHVSKNGTIET